MKVVKSLTIRILAVAFWISPAISSGQANNSIVIGEKKIIHSTILGEDREYWVYLPTDYGKNSKKYPVLYITDGDAHFNLAAGISQFMSSQCKAPELIIVAIFHKDRNHDLTPTHIITDYQGIKGDEFIVSGGAGEFLQFIENELMILVENSYRTAPYRILAGHSLGGLFVVYSYLFRSNLFNAYIAMDPALWWDENFCERTLKSMPDNSQNFKNKLYISSSHLAPLNKQDNTIYRKAQNSFCKELNSKIKSKTRHDYFEMETHFLVPLQSLYNGLSYVFDDYYIYNTPSFKEDTSYIINHYKHASEIYGISPFPPEGLIERTGYVSYIFFKDFKKAIEFCKLNVNNYPDSFKAYENLAKAYLASGNTSEAILNFKKSLELNPENKEIQKLLNELIKQ